MDFIDLVTQKNRIKTEIMNTIESVIDNGQFILGKEVAELESMLASYTQSKFCITNANGTDALVLALRALNISSGDEVIVPAFTFFATAEAVSLVGAKPVFVDIDPSTYNIDYKCVENAITAKTKAVIAVGLYGLCPDFKNLNAVCSKNKIAIIEDAAQNFGATVQEQRACGIATISCTSFFPSKPLGCYGDGGACFTNDEGLAKTLKELRTHGQEKRYVHTNIGYNSRLDTIQAAILIKKLEIFPEEIILRNKVAKRYQAAFSGKLKMQSIPENFQSVFAQFTIEVSNRDQFQKDMTEAKIPTAIHYPIPLHKQPVYLEQFGNMSLPISESAAQRVVSLPMHPYLDEKTQNFIIETVLKYAKN